MDASACSSSRTGSPFVDLMQRIIDSPPVDNELALYNAIAGRRAGIYLTAVDALFE
jgi:hypothetical protein